MSKKTRLALLCAVILMLQGFVATAQEARARYEMMKLIQTGDIRSCFAGCYEG